MKVRPQVRKLSEKGSEAAEVEFGVGLELVEECGEVMQVLLGLEVNRLEMQMHLTVIGTSAAKDQLHVRQALGTGKEKRTRNVGLKEIVNIAAARVRPPTVVHTVLT